MKRCRFVSLVLAGLVAHATVVWGDVGSTTRKAIELDPAKIEAVVGQYQLDSTKVLSISKFRDHLYARTTGGRPYAIYPESETLFFYGDADARITIEKDAHGKVTGARFDQKRMHKAGKKISDVAHGSIEAPEILDSPRVAALAKDIDGGDAKALEKFWTSVQDHAPLVEALAGNARWSWVTFLYHGDATTRSVQVRGGPWADSFDLRGMNLSRLRETDLWYRSVRMPNDARITYAYVVNLTCRLPDNPEAEQELIESAVTADVLNPKFIPAMEMVPVMFSVLELPDAPAQPYIHVVPGTPSGKVTGQTIESDILNRTRTYSLYTPPEYDDKSDACPLVVLFDGSMYSSESLIPGPTIIDNLIAAKKIPPIVVAFVNSIDRNKDLNCSKDFAAFVAKELVPQIRRERHVSSEAKQTTVGGLSLGGLMATYCGLNHSDVFGNVISQSGAYWIYPGALDTPRPPSESGGPLIDEFVKSPKLPIRFYVEAGKFEDGLPSNLLGENRRFRDVLRVKGYDITYSEFSGGHHYVNWRGSFSDALIAVTR